MRFLAPLALAVLMAVPAADAWLVQGVVTVDVQVFDSDGEIQPCVGVQTAGGGNPLYTEHGVIVYTGSKAPRGFVGFVDSGDCPR